MMIDIDWEIKKLNDICSNISTNNKRIKQKNYEEIADLPVIDQGDELIGGYTSQIESKVNCDLPAIIFGDHTKAVKFVNFDFAPGADGIKVLEPKKNINPKFLYYLLQRMVFEIPDKGYARHFQYLNKEEYPVPPLPTQHRIVEKIEELFSELDNGVENLKKAQKQLKTYRQAVLKDAFEGKLTEEWREQQDDLPTPDELLQQIKAERKAHRQRELAEWEKEVEEWEKDGNPGRKPSKPRKQSRPDIVSDKEFSTLPEIPEQWRYIKIGNVINSLDQGWSPRCKNEPASEGEWGVIKTTAIQDGKFLEFENKKLPDKFDPRKDHEIKKGDILITRAGPRSRVGICCFVKNVRKKLINCDKVYRIKTGAFNAKYLMYILNSPIFNRVLDEIKSGINDSGVNLTQTAFLKIIIPVTGIDEQKEIVNEIESRLSVVDQLEQTIKENLQKAEALRQSILKKAFGGELVV